MSGSTTTPNDVPERFQVDFTGRTLLGVYEVEARIASGGMGSVYRALDTNLGRPVVVKVPHARFLGEPGFRTRFRREINELVRLEHGHIVRILAQGEEADIPFFVLQYLKGGSLEDRLQEGPQPPEQVAHWLGPVGRTLDFIHARGVIHRDVKPANVLFDEEDHVFLSDFGVAKALDDVEAELTEAGTGVGSPYYMAPEQGRGVAITPAADQYALASTAFEALTGSPPFGRGSVIDVLVRKTKEESPAVADACPELPREAARTLERALSREPDMRFENCASFASAFISALEVPEAPEVSGRDAPRWMPVAASALVLLLLGAAVITRGFGLLDDDERQVAPVAAVPPSDVLIRVLEEGNAPRRLLRRGLREGDTRTIHTTTETVFQGNWLGGKPVEDRLLHVLRAQVMPPSRPGWHRVSWKLVPREPKDGEEPANYDGGFVRRSARNETHVGFSLVNQAGVAEGPAFRVTGEDEVDERMQGMAGMVRDFNVPLPDKAVGVGARWVVTRFAEMMGIRYQENVVVKLVSLDGNRAGFELTHTEKAWPQESKMPGMPEGMKSKLTRFELQSTTQLTLDLDRVGPTRHESQGAIQMAFELTHQGKTAKWNSELSFHTRGDAED